MTYKFKYCDYVKESGELKQDTLFELTNALNILLSKGTNFKMIVDSRDQECFTVITEA